MSNSDPVTRAAQVEELRFAKRQPWSVAGSVVTLLAAIFGVAQAMDLGSYERIAAVILIAAVVAFGCAFLYRLQSHLKATRLVLDPNDAEPWLRGVDVLRVLAGIVLVSGLFVGYSLFR